MITGRAGRRLRRSLLVFPLTLLARAARVDTGSAQVPARVATPYTLMDDGDRLNLEFGAETPLRGNGPFTGYGYFFYTRPHFLDEDLYLRLVIPPGYLISELIRDHWPSRNSAVGVGISGGLWAESQVEFRDGRFEKEESFSGHSAGGTFAYYLRGRKIGGLLPLEGQIRANPKYVWYDRTGDTARRFRLPENSAIYDGRAGIRLGGVPPQLFPDVALELSVWHAVSYRDAAATASPSASRRRNTSPSGPGPGWARSTRSGAPRPARSSTRASPRTPTRCPPSAWAAASACAPSSP